jgi:hypothetical protein
MKILMVVPSISTLWGGTTTSVLNFYKALSNLNNDIDVATTFLD